MAKSHFKDLTPDIILAISSIENNTQRDTPIDSIFLFFVNLSSVGVDTPRMFAHSFLLRTIFLYFSNKNSNENTFVYFDPPYRPLTDTASFTAYTENLFNDDSQRELADYVNELNKKKEQRL